MFLRLIGFDSGVAVETREKWGHVVCNLRRVEEMPVWEVGARGFLYVMDFLGRL